MLNNNEKYDLYGRLTFKLEPHTNTEFHYNYGLTTRIERIINNNNVSNFRTIKNQINQDDIWIDKSVEEFGETYYTLKKFDFGKEIYLKQINFKKHTIYIKHTKWKEEGGCVWIVKYNNINSVGFKTNEKLLKKWQTKI